MKKVIFASFVILLIVSVFQSADAMPFWGHHGPYEYYGEKNPASAALVSLFPPLAWGHFYADEWERGLLLTAGEVILGGTMVGTAIYESSNTPPADDGDEHMMSPSLSNWSDSGKAVFISAGLAYVGLKFWEAYDAASIVEEYNSRPRNSSIKPFFDGENIGVSYSLKF